MNKTYLRIRQMIYKNFERIKEICKEDNSLASLIHPYIVGKLVSESRARRDYKTLRELLGEYEG